MNTLGLNDPLATAGTGQPSNSNLVTCPHCLGLCSIRASVCPGCGCPFSREPLSFPSIPRIAMGVILGYLGILVISALLFFVVMAFFSALMANALSGVQPPASTSRR